MDVVAALPKPFDADEISGQGNTIYQAHSPIMLTLGLALGLTTLFIAFYAIQYAIKTLLSDSGNSRTFQLTVARYEIAAPGIEKSRQLNTTENEVTENAPAKKSLLPAHPSVTKAKEPAPTSHPATSDSDTITTPKVTMPTVNLPTENTGHLNSASASTFKWSPVFDPTLRAAIAESSKRNIAVSEGSAAISTYQDGDGDIIVQQGDRCFTVKDSALSPTGKQWSLPQRCHGAKSESDTMAQGLQAAMQSRFGHRKAQK